VKQATLKLVLGSQIIMLMGKLYMNLKIIPRTFQWSLTNSQ